MKIKNYIHILEYNTLGFIFNNNQYVQYKYSQIPDSNSLIGLSENIGESIYIFNVKCETDKFLIIELDGLISNSISLIKIPKIVQSKFKIKQINKIFNIYFYYKHN